MSSTTWSLAGAVEKFIANNFNDGDLISHDWLSWALELPTPKTVDQAREAQFVAMSRIEDFKQALLEDHCIYIVSVRGQGYRIVPPRDQARLAAARALQATRREVATCQKVMTKTRTTLLSTDEMRRHTDTQLKIAALSGMLDKSGRNIFALFDGNKSSNQGA